jgi:hypothetical protein
MFHRRESTELMEREKQNLFFRISIYVGLLYITNVVLELGAWMGMYAKRMDSFLCPYIPGVFSSVGNTPLLDSSHCRIDSNLN